MSRLNEYLEHGDIDNDPETILGQIQRLIKNRIKDEEAAEEIISLIIEYGEAIQDNNY